MFHQASEQLVVQQFHVLHDFNKAAANRIHVRSQHFGLHVYPFRVVNKRVLFVNRNFW